MQSVASASKLIKKIKDEKFDVEKLQEYTLLINMSARDFQIGVIDNVENRLLLLEDHVLNDPKDHNDQLEIVKTLFDSHELLQVGFWKEVIIGVKNNKFVQVPVTLFDKNVAADYLKFNAKVDDDEVVLYSTSSSTDAISVFAFHKGLHDLLMRYYKNAPVRFVHQSHALISGCLTCSQGDLPLYIYVDRFKLHILCLKNNRLAYYNQFLIKQFQDYVKYIMLVMKSMNMDQETSQVVLWGYIGKNSPHYQEFIKYVRNVAFGGRLPNLKMGYQFDEVQEHHYFDLLSLSIA